MADANLAALIPDPMPEWLQRAMDPSTPTTDKNKTVFAKSFYSEQHGGELLVPTIRLGEQGLYEPEDPFQASLDLGDFILIPGPPGAETEARATALSKFISDTLITNARAGQVDKPLYDKLDPNDAGQVDKPLYDKLDPNDATAVEDLGYDSSYDFEGTPYALRAKGELGKDPFLGLSLVPDQEKLPRADVSLARTGGDSRGILSVGNPNLSYSREVRLPEDNGREIYDRVEGGIGPFSGYFMESEFPEGTGSDYGGSLNLGPFTLFGNQATSQQNVIPEADRRYFTDPNVDMTRTNYGLRGSWDVGIGTLRGGAERTHTDSRLPQSIGQESRPTAHKPHVSRYNLGLAGDNFDVGGGLTNVRNGGTQLDLHGYLKWLNLLNLGGELGVGADWRKPMEW
jgi:hypothetical protein